MVQALHLLDLDPPSAVPDQIWDSDHVTSSGDPPGPLPAYHWLVTYSGQSMPGRAQPGGGSQQLVRWEKTVLTSVPNLGNCSFAFPGLDIHPYPDIS